MENTIITIDERYSTTRMVSTIPPQIENHPEAQFQTHLSLPEGEGRQGEGGLRTKGYYKHSYEVIDGQWYITDNFGVREEDVQRIPVDQEQVPNDLVEYVQNEFRQGNDAAEAEGTDPEYSGRHIKLPLISVITVVFNGEKYLKETIESVVNQTYPNVEYIIIDGCSNDSTLDIVERYEGLTDYWVSENDGGIYDAWNKGLKLFFGDWVSFLGAGDFYKQNAINMYIHKIVKSKDLELVSSKVMLCDTQKNNIREVGNRWSWSKFSKRMNIAHVGSLHKRFLFQKYGIFDDSYKVAGDYELLLRAKESLQVEFISYITCYMTIGGASHSNPEVFNETKNAKLIHKTRPCSLLALFEMYYAKLKWIIRKHIWHCWYS